LSSPSRGLTSGGSRQSRRMLMLIQNTGFLFDSHGKFKKGRVLWIWI
jgi:hypothetical protein